MNFKKTVAIVLTSSVLLAGCTVDKKQLRDIVENVKQKKKFKKEESYR